MAAAMMVGASSSALCRGAAVKEALPLPSSFVGEKVRVTLAPCAGKGVQVMVVAQKRDGSGSGSGGFSKPWDVQRSLLASTESRAVATEYAPNAILGYPDELLTDAEDYEDEDEDFDEDEVIRVDNESVDDEDELAVANLGIPDAVVEALANRGISQLFPIQVNYFPDAMR